MVQWLVPISLFWLVAPIFLGGWPVDVKGGNPVTQVLGLLVSFAVFLVVWAVLRAVFAGFGAVPHTVLPAILTTLLLPFISMAGFRILGIKIVHSSAH
jgi:formate hydrogenlyase subunit 4